MGWYSRWDRMQSVPFDDLIGKKIVRVEGDRGSNHLHFYTECGKHYEMQHYQDCCESVYLDQVDGDLQALVGGTVQYASESTDAGPTGEYGDVSQWTFYRIRTEREFVHLTWRGSSNGYYSTSVSFELEVPQDGEDTDYDSSAGVW